MLDPERAQIEKLEPTLFDIVLRPEEFISESSLEDESDYLEEIPAALIPLLSPQEPKEEQQPLDPNDYDQFRYYIITRGYRELLRECVNMGAAGAETRRSLVHQLLHLLILRLLVLCAPAVLRPRALQDAPAPADPNS